MNKIVKIVLAVLGLLSAILWYQLPGQEVPPGEAAQSAAMNGMFLITFLLLGVAVVASLLFTLVNLIAHPEKLKKSLMVIGGISGSSCSCLFRGHMVQILIWMKWQEEGFLQRNLR